jgi:hypothetical protein
MKSVIGPLVIAILLLLAGGAFWTAGHVERRLADVHQQLATLRYDEAISDDEDVEASLGLVRRLPRLGDELAADARNEHATAQYWRSEYPALEPHRDAGGALTEKDPEILLLTANAEFRATQHAADRAEMLRRLDKAVKTYGDAQEQCRSRRGPNLNTWSASARSQRSRERRRRHAACLAQRGGGRGQRPAVRPALHGAPGTPPKGTDMSQFKIGIEARRGARTTLKGQGRGKDPKGRARADG